MASSSMFPPCAVRKGKKKGCSLYFPANDPYMTVMSLRSLFHDGEANARTGNSVLEIWRPVKSLKDSLAILNPDHRSKIMNGYNYFTTAFLGGNLYLSV